MAQNQLDNMSEARIILITGGGHGIGASISARFQAAGDTVVIAQRSQPDNSQAHWIEIDLSDADATATVIDQIQSRFQRLDVLINNAGVMREQPVSDDTLDDWHATLAVNLTAPYILSKAALPLLQAQQGSIINISSIEGDGANPNHAAYGASKSGLNGLTRAFAIDAGPLRVRCNAIAPGWIDTALNAQMIEQQADPDGFKSKLTQLHPVGHIGHPDDVAALAFWLSSEEARFVTGQIWTIDGGRTTQLSLPQ